jgi:hypothetical protein
MKFRLIKARDICKDDDASWRRLAERAVEPNPYAEPDFFRVSSRHFEGYARADAAWVEAPTDKDNWSLHLLPEHRTLTNVLIGTGGLLDRSLVSALPAMRKVVTLPSQARNRWSQSRTPTSTPNP